MDTQPDHLLNHVFFRKRSYVIPEKRPHNCTQMRNYLYFINPGVIREAAGFKQRTQ